MIDFFRFQSIPGGFNALRRLYTDVQEPMMNAAEEQVCYTLDRILLPFKCQPHKIVKHTQTISVSYILWGRRLKG